MGTGWLSPTGEFIECESREHFIIAYNIAQRIGLHDENCNSDDVLLKHGWIRISMLTFFEHGFCFSYKRESASENQKIFLLKFYDKHRKLISFQGKLDLYQLGVIDDEYEPT